jgi:hypothetical protein
MILSFLCPEKTAFRGQDVQISVFVQKNSLFVDNALFFVDNLVE